ncbi:hypothetical protein BGZ61DRAFT_533107 [Ilyonectria robusta]|uniref:uncharacterized protein n=1 Tax=Ilyonectria robusta TaxID=1079257 RepID=UPI001E8DF51C|nr:uncharacterized protein BGZ61DRAFT_533107 [Ilyonectria robusta]KAH8688323.1 hypothetical protein BGZ61DRAFT_533107 [Ilyonectria robusta]
MTSNALIWNPLAKADRMLVYYNSSKGNLGLRQWTDGEEGWGPVWAEKEESTKGNVLVGGGLTALQWRDWIRVYGITTVKDATAGKEVNYISLLSPVVQSLSIKTNYNRLTGSSDGKVKAYLYFFTAQQEPNNSSDPPVLNERSLDNSSTKPLNKGLTIMKSPAGLSSIAATYSLKTAKRWVFVQLENKEIVALNGASTESHTVTKDAKPGTPLAAVSFIEGEKEAVVVYYVRNTDGFLARASSLDAGATWSDVILEGAGVPTQETLSAASKDSLKKIAVVFSAEDSTETQIHVDEWEAILKAPASDKP